MRKQMQQQRRQIHRKQHDLLTLMAHPARERPPASLQRRHKKTSVISEHASECYTGGLSPSLLQHICARICANLSSSPGQKR
ncbi:hypothetical protein BaRGS_00027635 [Batillaria attramentaria]|uniref:Uncharacterized protein n=1 Tax=Batillaria attramentaria TaxID=370345 RepID=A0ABD0K2B6_9CAEN